MISFLKMYLIGPFKMTTITEKWNFLNWPDSSYFKPESAEILMVET
jgi:hypothetical protein